MADTSVKFYAGRWQQLLRKTFVPRLRRIGILLRTKVVRKISVPFRDGGKTVRYNPKRYGTPSKEGEPPRTDLGRLRQSIFYRVHEAELSVEVGTAVEYGLYLEASRPYLRPTLHEAMPEIQKIMTR